MVNLIQRSMGHGEVHPALSARCDLDFYKAALSKCLNFIIPKQGGVQNRAGTEFVGDAIYGPNDSANYFAVREIPFILDDLDAFTLLFGHLFMKIIRNGAFVTELPLNITSITKANPAVVSALSHGYHNGDRVYITTTPFTGMPELGFTSFIVSAVTDNTFEITPVSDDTATLVNSTNFNAYVSGGTVARHYQISTVFSASEVAALDYAQYKNTMILTHPNHPQQKLVRTVSNASWTIGDLPIGTVDHVNNMSGTKGGAGNNRTRYKISYTDSTTGKESKPGTEGPKTIAAITNTNPPTVTVTSHSYATGDTVLFGNMGGMTELNGREFTIQVPGALVPDNPVTIVAISNANPMVVTATGHGYSNGDKISFNVAGMTELNDITYGTVVSAAANTFEVYYYGTTTVIDSTNFNGFGGGSVTRISPNPTATNTFTLVGVDATNYGVFSSGKCGRTCLTLDQAATATVGAPNVLSWDGISVGASLTSSTAAGVLGYTLYKESGGLFGKIGVTTDRTFKDIGYDPDFGNTPIQYRDIFFGANNYPACCAFNNQRLIFASSNNDPQMVWASRIGDFYNFSERQNILDDDALDFTISSTNIDPVRHLVPMRVLLCMSLSSEMVVEGTIGGSAFVPGGVNVHSDSHNGSGTIKPVVVNNSVIFTQKDLRVLRDLFYSFQLDSYDSTDLTALAAHLLIGHSIVDMAYQKSPNSIIWMVRDDGILISCTLVKDQSILAFAQHAMDGIVSNVCCIPEGDETALYLVIKKPHGTNFIERMATRTIGNPTDITDSIFVDCALTYNGDHDSGANGGDYAKLTSGTTYAAGELMTVHTTIVNSFTALNVGDVIVLRGTNMVSDTGAAKTSVETIIFATVISFTNSQNLVVQPDKDVPAEMQNIYTTSWGIAKAKVGGLWHLEGREIAVTGDAWVVANPNNDSYDVVTVSSGGVTFPSHYVKIHAGIGYVSDLTTCDIDNPQGPSMITKHKLINSVTVYPYNTREFWAGEELPSDSGKGDLKPIRQHRTGETEDLPPALFSNPQTVNIKARWNKGGRIAIRNLDPLPCEIIAISPDFHVGS